MSNPLPTRAERVMAIVRWAILALTAALAVGSWIAFASAQHHHAPSVAIKYQCPMHPQIVADTPGSCPICHMTLVPVAADRLAPPPPIDGGPPGLVAVTLSDERAQQIGVRTAVAAAREGPAQLRVTAVIAAADQAVAEVHVRAPGFVERIPVDQVGVRVTRGDELLAVYSPEVFQAETELLAAKQWGEGGARAVDAARTKLELLGVEPRDLDRIVAAGVAQRAFPVRAPASGVVTKKTVVRGAYVTPEMPLYTLEDLSRVYVVADVFAQDVASVPVGSTARFTLRARADVTASGRVDLVYPSVDPQAHTARVRITVPNPGGQLRPGDYGDVDFAVKGGREITVPRDALVDTGEAAYVFVEGPPGRYTPRAVEVAPSRGDEVVVRRGLAAGERVVSGATFLLDAESRLHAGAAAGGDR